MTCQHRRVVYPFPGTYRFQANEFLPRVHIISEQHMAMDETRRTPSYLFHCASVLRSPRTTKTVIATLHSTQTIISSDPIAYVLHLAGSNPVRSAMAASMATSTVSKAVLLPSNDASHSTPVSPRNPSLRFRFRPSAGVIGGRWNAAGIRRLQVVAMSSPPPAKGKISDLVDESIKHATEVCAGNDKSGECAAAWDEVEEVSAAASDIRTKEKVADPLENFCKDNPETDECRTYDS